MFVRYSRSFVDILHQPNYDKERSLERDTFAFQSASTAGALVYENETGLDSSSHSAPRSSEATIM
jgi:hypothetical protein